MPEYFDCPYLGGRVELNDERRRHIETEHPAEAETIMMHLGEVVSAPDAVFVKRYAANERAFVKAIRAGTRSVVVAIIITDTETRTVDRHWIVTAWTSRRSPRESLVWLKEQ